MMTLEDFPSHSVVKTPPSNTGVQIQLLLGELRSHMPYSAAKNKQINNFIKRTMPVGKHLAHSRLSALAVFMTVHDRNNTK